MRSQTTELARKAFAWGTWMVGAAVLIQFLLAGLGVFAYAGFFFWHAVVNASVIFFLPLLLVLIGWIGGVPGRLLWLAAAISGLTVLQSLLLAPYHMAAEEPWRAISGLHVLNALFLFWVTLQLVERTREWREGAPAADAAAGASRGRARPASNPHFTASDGPANRSLEAPVLPEETGRADQ